MLKLAYHSGPTSRNRAVAIFERKNKSPLWPTCKVEAKTVTATLNQSMLMEWSEAQASRSASRRILDRG